MIKFHLNVKKPLSSLVFLYSKIQNFLFETVITKMKKLVWQKCSVIFITLSFINIITVVDQKGTFYNSNLQGVKLKTFYLHKNFVDSLVEKLYILFMFIFILFFYKIEEEFFSTATKKSIKPW